MAKRRRSPNASSARPGPGRSATARCGSRTWRTCSAFAPARPGATRSDAPDVTSLRAARDALVSDETKRGREFGTALAALIDASLAPTVDEWAHTTPVALVAF